MFCRFWCALRGHPLTRILQEQDSETQMAFQWRACRCGLAYEVTGSPMHDNGAPELSPLTKKEA